MSDENDRTRAVLVRYYDEICDELIAPDYVNHSAPLPDLPAGPEGLKQTVAAVRRAFPDVHYKIEDMVIGRDKAALRVTMRGTHRGEFLGVAQGACSSGSLISPGTADRCHRYTTFTEHGRTHTAYHQLCEDGVTWQSIMDVALHTIVGEQGTAPVTPSWRCRWPEDRRQRNGDR